jgi:hypothetical protein
VTVRTEEGKRGPRARLELPLALVVGVVVRVPFWVEALRTPLDGDTAIIGLMARHPGHGTTMWGQPYGSPLEAWWAGPLFALFGADASTLRLAYFVLGLALIPAGYLLARALDPAAAFPASLLLACPPPYLLLLAAMPPPMYPAALLLEAVSLALALRIVDRLAAGGSPRRLALAWGLVSGLALWTHLMSAAVVVASGVVVLWRGGRRGAVALTGLLAMAAASAPGWTRAVADGQSARVVSLSGRRAGLLEHLGRTLPRLHEPLGGLLGTHVPLVADDPDFVVRPAGLVAAAVVLVYGLSIVAAVRVAAHGAGPDAARAAMLLASITLTVCAFPFPLRSGPAAIRFLTPAYLPIAALVAWAATRAGGARRAWMVVLALAALHLAGGARLLAAWRMADRTAAPFLLADLRPARALLETRGIRRAYASYGPAYRLTFETGERTVVSQPWNERFLHYELPYLDEVRFSRNVAWILTPSIPSDLPAPKAFEEALGRAGGSWRRSSAGAAVVYDGFSPPFSPAVETLATAGPAGDGDPATALHPDPVAPLTFNLPTPRALDAITLVAGGRGARLLRSMDVEVSADGHVFETAAARRRRDEREDLRWVNGHPQYVLDHDLLAVPLGGRTVASVRVRPVASQDPWTLAEVLLHPAGAAVPRGAWDEWLDPNLGWPDRRRVLVAQPRPDREDWYYRWGLVERRD